MRIHILPGYKDHFSKSLILSSSAGKYISQRLYEGINGLLHDSNPLEKGRNKNN